MFAKTALLLVSILWVLLCMRFYTVISRENVLQRRLIAIGAGLGAGLIYIIGSMMLPFLNTLFQETPPPEINQTQDIRVMGK